MGPLDLSWLSSEAGGAYEGCVNLTGSPACGPNVISMVSAYKDCTNLTGKPVCGDKVVYMGGTGGGWFDTIPGAYENCINLTGKPVCGNNVTHMGNAYRGCAKLTGAPVCGPNVIHMGNAYCNCTNLSGNAYFYSPNVETMGCCFMGRNNSKRLNIYLLANSTTYSTASRPYAL